MTETSWAALRDLLIEQYDGFRNRLARRLGSTDLASETLQETWLHLNRVGTVGSLRDPEAYVLRVALNLAADRRDTENRRLTFSEVEALLQFEEDELDPERIALAGSEIDALARALNELSPRRRSIFILARVQDLPHRVIAERFGISTRMVERELRKALEHCGRRLDRKVIRTFGPRTVEPSL
jgi:RNA polymerase sigma factor (sigma-70 family)